MSKNLHTKLCLLISICCLLGLTSAFEQRNLQNSSTSFAECQAYFNQIDQIITSKKLGQLPQSFIDSVNMSGRNFQDMGQVDMCRETDGMTFVRLSIDTSGLSLYRGFCLVEQCNAEVLNANQLAAMAAIQGVIKAISSLFTLTAATPNQLTSSTDHIDFATLASSSTAISFEPWAEYTESKNNAAFVIAVMFISLCIAAAFGAPILKAVFGKKEKKDDQAKYQTLINYNQNGATMTTNTNDNSTISKPPGQGNDASTVSAVSSSSTNSQKKPRRQPMYWRVLQCWNIKENAKKMFVLKSNNDDLLIFNGIRTLCFMQVIFGHEFYLHMNYMNNVSDIMIEQQKPFILFAVSCLYSVDVFFWLGGFFLSYVVADEKMGKNLSFKKPVKAIMGFVFAVINRLFRILPCYFLVLMFYWKISPYLGASPTWDVYYNQSDNCDQRWWQNLLFIDNMFPGQHEKCFGWGWYLSNDFQMFVVGMILLIVYANNRKIGKLLIILSFVAVQTVSIWVSYAWNFKVPMNVVNLGVPHYYDDYYTKPWTRSPPYFIGLFLGVMYKEYQSDKSKKTNKSLLMNISKLVSKTNWKWASYFVGITIWACLVFVPHYLQVNGLDAWPNNFQNFWFGTCRTFYVIGVSMLIIPGMLGSKDLIVRMLSSKIFAFLQRLSFCGYLTHYIIILYTIWQTKDSVYYNCENLIALFLSEFFLTLLAAAIVTLIIEIPIMNLSGILLGGRKPSSAAPAAKPVAEKPEKQVFDINKSEISSANGDSVNQPILSKADKS